MPLLLVLIFRLVSYNLGVSLTHNGGGREELSLWIQSMPPSPSDKSSGELINYVLPRSVSKIT